MEGEERDSWPGFPLASPPTTHPGPISEIKSVQQVGVEERALNLGSRVLLHL